MTEIWHNPRCSKSRQTLALLQEHGITPTIRLYQQDAPSEREIQAILSALNIPAIALMRTGDSLFKELGLTKDTDNDRLIAVMAAHPALIERPVVLHEDRAALGRPPESVLDLF